jgi:hypothetical protein
MKRQSVNLTRKVTVRFKQGEYEKVNALFKKTTKRKLSEYIRSILLEKPVTVYTRSQSMDALMAELILVRAELNAIGNNFNQTVKKLHTLDTIDEIKLWAITNEITKEIIFQKITEIQNKIDQFSDKWLQE